MADDLRDAISGLMRSTPGARVLNAVANLGESAQDLYGRVTRGSRRATPAARTTDIELAPERGKRQPARSGNRSSRR